MIKNKRLVGLDAMRMLSGLLIVVFHFTYCLGLGKQDFVVRILRAFSWVTPVFFLISGYLQGYNYQKETYVARLPSRFLRLFIPFCCWNLIFILGYLIVGKFFPTLAEGWMGKDDCNVGWFLGKLFGVDTIMGDPVLWYVRELLLLLLVIPFIVWGLSGSAMRVGLFLLGACGLTVAMDYAPAVGFPSSVWVPPYSIICILSSIWLGLKRVDIERACHKYSAIMVCVGLCSIIVSLCVTNSLLLVVPLSCCALFWFGIMPLVQKLMKFGVFKIVGEVTFFIYAAHYMFIPALGLCAKKALLLFPGQLQSVIYVVLLIIFACVDVALCVGLYMLIRHISPAAARMLNGGGFGCPKTQR